MLENSSITDSNILEREPKPLEPHVAQNRELLDKAQARARTKFLQAFFPHEADRAVHAHEVEQIKTGLEYRRRVLQLAIDTRLQAVQEMCNQVLVTGKSEIRRRRQEFFAEQCLKLHTAMDNCADEFNLLIEQRFRALEKLQVECLRKREEERLLESVGQFHEMLAELSEGFMQIIHEGVSC